jgi:hypothetical protein
MNDLQEVLCVILNEIWEVNKMDKKNDKSSWAIGGSLLTFIQLKRMQPC